jgi:hypothetical protein
VNNPVDKPRPRPQPRPAGPARPTPAPAAKPSRPAPPPRPVRASADGTGPTPARRIDFGPDWRLTIIALPGAAFAALVGLFADDPAQRLFAVVVVVVLLALGLGDVIFAPRLSVDGQGLRVRAPFDRARLAWDQVDWVKATTSQRYGLRTSVLEISAGERLIVLDRRDLAADPWAVASRIREFRAGVTR